jgi:hypothetical protein
MNKFEALKEFQGWPADWQRLCAEYWIEMGDVDPRFVLAFPKQAEKTPLESVSPLWILDQPKAEKVAEKVAAKTSLIFTHNRLSVEQLEKDALDSLIYQQLSNTAIAKAMESRWPFRRTKKAWEQLARERRKLNSGKGGAK